MCILWLLLPVGITASNAFMGKVHIVPILYLLLPLGNAATREWVVWSWTTKLTWTVDSFENFQNAVFLKMSQIPSIAKLDMV